MTSLLPWAIQAVQRGWSIFPCNASGTVCPESGKVIDKQGALLRPNAPYKIRWADVATNDLSIVTSWWTYDPEFNIGVSCKKSGLLVVDCDMPKREYQLRDTAYGYLHDQFGPLVDGCDVLRELCRRLEQDFDALMQTYQVGTTSMGLHLYYRWPPDILASQASIVRGILDVRTNGGDRGGYVLGAGSRTEKGPYVVESSLPIADAPPWLVEWVKDKPAPVQPRRLFSQPGGSSNYSGLVDAVRDATEGNRNQSLLWSARAMCTEGVSLDEAEELLARAAYMAGLSDREARSTIRSAYRVQRSKEGK
jgi:hypothetical protein